MCSSRLGRGNRLRGKRLEMEVMIRLHHDQVASLLSGQEVVRIGCDSRVSFRAYLWGGASGR